MEEEEDPSADADFQENTDQSDSGDESSMWKLFFNAPHFALMYLFVL